MWADEVRESIAHGIEQCYSDVSNPTLQTDALEAALQTKIDEGEMAALTIGDGTITTAKIANGAITQEKLDPNISFEADDELDATSTNAIQNKVVAQAIGEVNESLATKAPASTVYTKAQMDAALANKVSTVNGVEPDATGNVAISAGGGIDGTAITLLMTILNECLYGSNQSDNLVSLNAALRGHSLVSISAVVDGVPLAGTPFSEVPFIVTATYSDDSTATVSNYTVSSGTVVNGSNTATISYGGMSTTVTFTASDTRAYTITYNLTNVTSSNNTTLIAENSSYTATLSVSGNDYEMSTRTITMGGTDVTSTVLSGNDILIQSVTGNVVITATATRIVYLDPLKKTRNGGYSTAYLYSDEFVTQVKTLNYNGVCGVTEFPALNECSIRYTLTNNTESDISLNGVGIGMIPSYDSDHMLNIANGQMHVAYWTAIDNSNHALSPGSSLTGRITLKAGYQLAFTADSMNAYDNLTLALTGGYEADRFTGYRQIVDNATLAIFGGYRTINFYSDNGITALRSGNSSNHRNIASDIAVGTYDVQFRYVPTDIAASSTHQFSFAAGMVTDATSTTSNYGFGALSGKTNPIPFVWFNGSLTVSESGMTLTDNGPAFYGGDGSYVDIRIKEAS